MKISVKGLDRVLSKLNQVEQAVDNGSKIGLKKAAFLMEREAKQTVAVDTGRTKASISTVFENGGYSAHVAPHTYWSRYLEYGTGKYNVKGPFRATGWSYYVSDARSKWYGRHWTDGMKPKPFMKDAYENKKEAAKKIIKDEIKKSINSVK